MHVQLLNASPFQFIYQLLHYNSTVVNYMLVRRRMNAIIGQLRPGKKKKLLTLIEATFYVSNDVARIATQFKLLLRQYTEAKKQQTRLLFPCVICTETSPYAEDNTGRADQ